MTVEDLIQHLLTLPLNREIVYRRYSAYEALEKEMISAAQLVPPAKGRPWWAIPETHPDAPSFEVVTFPGN